MRCSPVLIVPDLRLCFSSVCTLIPACPAERFGTAFTPLLFQVTDSPLPEPTAPRGTFACHSSLVPSTSMLALLLPNLPMQPASRAPESFFWLCVDALPWCLGALHQNLAPVIFYRSFPTAEPGLISPIFLTNTPPPPTFPPARPLRTQLLPPNSSISAEMRLPLNSPPDLFELLQNYDLDLSLPLPSESTSYTTSS